MNPITAEEVYYYLSSLKKQGHELGKILIYFRQDSDSDVEVVTHVGEDLFDSETNSKLESIVFMADASDYE